MSRKTFGVTFRSTRNCRICNLSFHSNLIENLKRKTLESRIYNFLNLKNFQTRSRIDKVYNSRLVVHSVEIQVTNDAATPSVTGQAFQHIFSAITRIPLDSIPLSRSTENTKLLRHSSSEELSVRYYLEHWFPRSIIRYYHDERDGGLIAVPFCYRGTSRLRGDEV